MTLVATDSYRLSHVLKAYDNDIPGWCFKSVSAYEATAKTYAPGSVLVRTLTSGAGTGAAVASNTGGATIGAITVYSNAKVGVYTVKGVTSSATGAFAVFYPDGSLVGHGAVGTAFVGGGISFSLTDGTPDIAVGDTYTITVTGTEQYSLVQADSPLEDVVMFVWDNLGNSGSTAIAATTATTVVVLYRGRATVSDAGLIYGSTVDTTAEKNAVKAALEAKGIAIAVAV